MRPETSDSGAGSAVELPATSAVGTALAQEVERRLRASPYPELRRVRCVTVAEQATLLGQANSYHVKQMAQQIAASVHGVKSVTNRLEVVPRKSRQDEQPAVFNEAKQADH